MVDVRLFSLCLLLGALPLSAQKPQLLKDINRNSQKGPSSSQPRPGASQTFMGAPSFVLLGKSLLVVATQDSVGRELFVTQGSLSTTQVLRDINKGKASSDPASVTLTRDGTLAFFAATDGVRGRELWVTNGTAVGTRLVKDLVKGGGSSSPHKIVTIGAKRVLFVATTPATDKELFISDGTAAGTHLLKDIVPGIGGGNIGDLRSTRDGKRVFFSAHAPAMGPELWVSDGTSKGTRLVLELDPSRAGVDPRHFTPLAANQILFLANTPKAGLSVWASDGTKQGTRLVYSYKLSSKPDKGFFRAIAIGDRVLFNGHTAKTGFEPWFTDGSMKGTGLLLDAYPGPVSGGLIAPILDSSGKRVFFSSVMRGAWADHYRIYVSNGTFLGTRIFLPKPLSIPATHMLESGGKVWFEGKDVSARAGVELSVTDGSLAGTKTLVDIAPGAQDGGARYLTRLPDGSLFFVASDGASGEEPRVLKSGQVSLIDLNDPQLPVTMGSSPRRLIRFGNKIVFSAYDGLMDLTPYISDGTAKGTVARPFLRKLNGSRRDNEYAPLGDKILFNGFSMSAGEELWISDGTEVGTHLLADLVKGANPSEPSGFRAAGKGVYFWARGAESSFVPWFTDGTAKGTIPLLRKGFQDPMGSTFAGHGDRVIFLCRDAASGYEPWITDGTPAGTRLLKDIYPGTGSSMPRYFTVSGGRVFFGAKHPKTGTQLWVTDGTTAGTVRVKGLSPSAVGYSPADLSARHGKVYYRGWATNRDMIYVSDGTARGSRVFLDLRSVGLSSYATQLSAVGSRHVYFQVGNGGNKKLYVSDGTKAGTKTINLDSWYGYRYGFFFPYPDYRVVLGSKVFSPGVHPAFGLEMFYVENGATAEPVGTSHGSTWLEGSDPVLGQTATIRVGTRLGKAVHVLLAGQLAATPRRIVGSGWSLLDLASPVIVVATASRPSFQVSLPVPKTTALLGLQLAFQSWSFDSRNLAGTLELSNALEWTLGN